MCPLRNKSCICPAISSPGLLTMHAFLHDLPVSVNSLTRFWVFPRYGLSKNLTAPLEGRVSD